MDWSGPWTGPLEWSTGLLDWSTGSGACAEDKINGSAINGWGQFRWQCLTRSDMSVTIVGSVYKSWICYLEITMVLA